MSFSFVVKKVGRMNYVKNVVEYYDELFPVTAAQTKFYESLGARYQMPAKILRVGCGTGFLEHTLAKSGYDVTGIESSRDILSSANLRRRSQLMSIRFFLMSPLEMRHFLGKGFYNIISILNDRIIHIGSPELMLDFFRDCKALLTKDGSLVVGMSNFSKTHGDRFIQLPVRESIRARLFTEIHTAEDGGQLLCQNLETGNGRMMPVTEGSRVHPVPPETLCGYAREAGFSDIQLFSDFGGAPFSGGEPEVVALMR